VLGVGYHAALVKTMKTKATKSTKRTGKKNELKVKSGVKAGLGMCSVSVTTPDGFSRQS
jgi:hypothetical protein